MYLCNRQINGQDHYFQEKHPAQAGIDQPRQRESDHMLYLQATTARLIWEYTNISIQL